MGALPHSTAIKKVEAYSLPSSGASARLTAHAVLIHMQSRCTCNANFGVAAFDQNMGLSGRVAACSSRGPDPKNAQGKGPHCASDRCIRECVRGHPGSRVRCRPPVSPVASHSLHPVIRQALFRAVTYPILGSLPRRSCRHAPTGRLITRIPHPPRNSCAQAADSLPRSAHGRTSRATVCIRSLRVECWALHTQ